MESNPERQDTKLALKLVKLVVSSETRAQKVVQNDIRIH